MPDSTNLIDELRAQCKGADFVLTQTLRTLMAATDRDMPLPNNRNGRDEIIDMVLADAAELGRAVDARSPVARASARLTIAHAVNLLIQLDAAFDMSGQRINWGHNYQELPI